MIAGLVQILLFQGAGELASRFVLPLVPGPVIGLVLLLAFLAIRKSVPKPVELVASTLVQHLAMGLHGILGAVAIPFAVSFFPW